MVVNPNGRIVTWVENGQDKWEWSDDPEMIVHLYDQATTKCDKDQVYLFKAEVLSMGEMDKDIQRLRMIAKF